MRDNRLMHSQAGALPGRASARPVRRRSLHPLGRSAGGGAATGEYR